MVGSKIFENATWRYISEEDLKKKDPTFLAELHLDDVLDALLLLYKKLKEDSLKKIMIIEFKLRRYLTFQPLEKKKKSYRSLSYKNFKRLIRSEGSIYSGTSLKVAKKLKMKDSIKHNFYMFSE